MSRASWKIADYFCPTVIVTLKVCLISLLTGIVFLNTASAQNSMALTKADPTKTYFAMKRSFGSIPKEFTYPRDEFMLRSCLSVTEVFVAGDYPDLIWQMMELAFATLWMNDGLRRIGYPTFLWLSDVEKYEGQQLHEIVASNGKRSDYLRFLDSVRNGSFHRNPDPWRVSLAKKLNRYRTTQRGLSTVVPVGECGGSAGGLAVEVDTIPSSDQIQYISQHFVDLCTDK